MESEKVKEIKKALEDNKTDHLPYIDGYKCKFVDYFDILTLINELESENERLNKALVENLEAYKDRFNEGAVLKKGVDNKLKTENQQLKDRISELEKVYDRQVRIINDLNIEVVKMQEKLTKFAEKLKEKLTKFY